MSYTVTTAFAALVVYAVWRVLQIGKRPAGLPPGPPTIPIFGNSKDFPPWHLHLKFSEWATKYGPLVSAMRGNQPTIIVSDAKSARDLFDKMGTVTSSRPADYISSDLASANYNIAFQSSSPRWRQGRKIFHSILNVSATRRYVPYQELETTKLVYDILESPNNWHQQVFRYSNSIGLLLVAGQRVPYADNADLQEIRKNNDEFSLITLKGGLLNYFPVLRRLPLWLFPSARHAEEHRLKDAKIALKHFLPLKNPSDKRSILPSLNRALVEKQEKDGFPDIQAARWGLDLLGAATDTTAMTLVNFFAVMALFPEVQRKVHEELDRVVGTDRIPNNDDFPDLTYVRQIIQELHRWGSVVPICIPHVSTRPINYADYHIPADSTLIINAWHIHNDPAQYPEPRAFKPERWEGKLQEAKEDSVGARSELFVFGAGRRICPGQHLAEKNLFLTISKILWACDIAKAKGEDGKELEIDADNFTPGVVMGLAKYPVSIRPRSRIYEDLIQADWKAGSEEFLDEDEQWKKAPQGVEELMFKAKN